MRLLLCILITGLSLCAAHGMDKKQALETLSIANSKLDTKQYSEAVNLYESVADEFRSVQLYHNLGLAYFYQEDLALAILNMERALKLGPSNKSVKRNLKLLNENVDSEIVNRPDFFLRSWYNGISNLAGASTWLFLHLGLLVVAIFFLFQYLIKKWDFGLHYYYIRGLIIGLTCLSLIFAAFSYNRYSRIANVSTAIVVLDSTPLRLGAEDNSEEIMKVNQGVKVFIKDEIGEFYKIRLEDYTEAWVLKANVEVI